MFQSNSNFEASSLSLLKIKKDALNINFSTNAALTCDFKVFTLIIFQPMSVITTIIKCVLFIVIRVTDRKWAHRGFYYSQ